MDQAIMEQLLVGVGLLLSALFGNEQVQRWRNKRNGDDATGRITKKLDEVADVIRSEGKQTRAVIHGHNEVALNRLAGMKEACAVSHAQLLDRTDK
jgi:hypothetical protein